MYTSLYSTIISHQRFRKFKNKFKYFLFSLYLDHDELIDLSKKIKIFSYNSFNIISFYEKDHGYRDGKSLRIFVENHLKSQNFIFNHLKIRIFCFPRVLGYVFNPLSIIYCYEDKNLIAIFYEVKNTSNEQHTYFFARKNNKNFDKYIHQCNKNFYVSPFIGMKGIYKFKNTIPKDKIAIIIDLFDENNKKILSASQYGNKISLSSISFLKQLIYNPFLTFKVIFGILYESVFIYIKGGKYYSRKKKIIDSISFEGKL